MFQSEVGVSAIFVRMSAELVNIDKAGAVTKRFLEEHGMGGQSFGVLLGMREALANAVVHGCGKDPLKEVRYQLSVKNATLTMRVEDQGQGFDWRKAPREVPDPEATSGRGMPILHQYFDEVSFNDMGNILEMRMHCSKGNAMSEVSREGEHAVVKPGRDIVASMAGEFREELKQLIDEGMTEITLDLEGVGMVDSIGMGLLIATHNSLGKKGGKLSVRKTPEEILGLMRTMRLDKHFEISGS